MSGNPQNVFSPNSVKCYNGFSKATCEVLSHLNLIVPTSEDIILPSISLFVSNQFFNDIDLNIMIMSNVIPKTSLSITPANYILPPIINIVHFSSKPTAVATPIVTPIVRRFYKKTREISSALIY